MQIAALVAHNSLRRARVRKTRLLTHEDIQRIVRLGYRRERELMKKEVLLLKEKGQ
jgi:hypothetical protein